MKVKITDKQTGDTWIGQISIMKQGNIIGVQGFYYPHENGCKGNCYFLGGCGALWQNPDYEYHRFWEFLRANFSQRKRQKLVIQIQNALTAAPIVREIEPFEEVADA
jgi:hypothetical protein